MNDILPERLGIFPAGCIELLDDYETRAFSLETAYLKSLDTDRLLKGFCETAGIGSSAQIYGGWEDSAIRGHTLGHYLTAVSQAYAASGDRELLAAAEHIIDVLARCQNAATGYLSAIPEEHYARLERGVTEGTWVPWYTMHKVMSGVIAAYELAGIEKALVVASRLGDWVYSRTSAWTEEVRALVLGVEYGGMNDCLYQLYSLTGSEKHLAAAHSFDELPLLTEMYEDHDILNGKHANTTIPKITGALRRYIVLGREESFYLRAAENFWAMVVGSHTYATGGNSEWEHFGEPGVLNAERTECNCETCNVYNMLKLTRELFRLTGDAKYADYYENAFINAILSSQDPVSGMTTYFQPMATGFFKVYGTPTESFWCCTGSGMENFSKLGDSIYFHDEDSVVVLRYTSSRLHWREKGLTISQRSGIPRSGRVEFTVGTTDGGGAGAALVLRVPGWCAGEPEITINGSKTAAETNGGYIRLVGLKNGDVIGLNLPMTVRAQTLPDEPHAVAFSYGPVLLSADMGDRDMTTGVTGVNVTVPHADPQVNEVITVTGGSADEWLEKIAENLVRNGDALEFTLKNTDRELTFTPHFMQHTKRYGIYFIIK